MIIFRVFIFDPFPSRILEKSLVGKAQNKEIIGQKMSIVKNGRLYLDLREYRFRFQTQAILALKSLGFGKLLVI